MEGEKPVENKRGKTGSPAINGLQVRSCIGVATCSLLHWKVFFSINNLGRTMSSLDYLKKKKIKGRSLLWTDWLRRFGAIVYL